MQKCSMNYILQEMTDAISKRHFRKQLFSKSQKIPSVRVLELTFSKIAGRQHHGICFVSQ